MLIEDVEIVEAKQPEELRAVASIWRDVYGGELGWLNRAECNPLNDRYHPHAHYLLATGFDTERGEKVPLGTLRVVLDSSEGLPVEQFFPLSPIKHRLGRIGETQRLMVLSRYRAARPKGCPFGVFGALARANVQYCLQNRFDHLVVDAFLSSETTPIDAFKALGFEAFGPPFRDTELVEPSESVLMIMSMPRLMSTIFSTPSALLQYFYSPDWPGDSRARRQRQTTA